MSGRTARGQTARGDAVELIAQSLEIRSVIFSIFYFFKGSEIMSFKTINVSADCAKIPASTLRRMLAKGELPGFYSGNRFYVNYEMLLEKLERDSLNAMSSKSSTSA